MTSGTMTLSTNGLYVNTQDKMTLSIKMLCPYAKCHCVVCGILFIVVLNVLLLSIQKYVCDRWFGKKYQLAALVSEVQPTHVKCVQFSIMTLSIIKGLFVTQQKLHLHYYECCVLFIVMLNAIMFSTVMLNIIMLNVIILNVILLNVIMVNVILLSLIM